MHSLPSVSLPIRLLLVEDNPDDLALLRELLQQVAALRYATAQSFATGQSFATAPYLRISYATALGEVLQQVVDHQFDIVLLALSRTDSQGYATFEQLYAADHTLPIILLIGDDEEERAMAQRAMAAGAQDYLAKNTLGTELLQRVIRYAIEQKQAQITLCETEWRYQALFEQTDIGIVFITLEGTYCRLNQQALRMLDYEQVDDLVGKPVTEFYIGTEQVDFSMQAARLRSSESIPTYEATLQRRAAAPLQLELNLSLVCNGNSRPVYIQLFARDISKRWEARTALHVEREQLTKRMLERTAQLSVANSELTRSARLKDEFLATVSHELRTPLSVILTLSEAVGDHVYGELNERQEKALHRIRKSGRHLLALINDILDVSKIESGKVQLEIGPVSVQTLCEDCIQMVQAEAQAKGLTLSVEIDQNAAILYADGRRLMQVLLNLLNNAIKFTPDNGSVALVVNGDTDHNQLTFVVQDTGIGIEENDMPKLFEPFVQLDSRLARQYQGAGLGLTLVYRLVKLHGGTVSVESEPGVGSRFLVALPWHKETKKAITKTADSKL